MTFLFRIDHYAKNLLFSMSTCVEVLKTMKCDNNTLAEFIKEDYFCVSSFY